MQPETNTNTITTPEPEPAKADPAAPAARESAADSTPIQAVELPAVPAQVSVDPLESLRAEMLEKLDVLADDLSTLTCHLINTQITAYRERRRALLMARRRGTKSVRHWQAEVQAAKDQAALEKKQAELEKATADALREENHRLEVQMSGMLAAAKAASKVQVSTSLNMAALDKPVAKADRAQAVPVTKEWADDHTLAYLRIGWRSYSPEEQEENAVALINDVCNAQPPKRSPTWHGLMRRVSLHGGVGSTPAEAFAATAEEDK